MQEVFENIITNLENEVLKSSGNMTRTYAFEKAIEIVKQAAEEYNNGWIPCRERLPECENGCETTALMFQLKTGTIEVGYFGVGGKVREKYFRHYRNSTDGVDASDVVAWKPLPEPYQQKGE